jgi:hypothetical protein
MEGTEMCAKESKTPNNKNNLEYLGVDSNIKRNLAVNGT